LTFPLVIFAVAFLAWLYRTLANTDTDPEPIILNLTLFAGIGTVVNLVVHTSRGETIGLLFVGLLMLAVLLLAVQVFIYRTQMVMASQHIREVLANRLRNAASVEEIDTWAKIASTLVKIDFFPEFYKKLAHGSGPRSRKRQQLVNFLPDSVFDKSKLRAEDFEVPENARKKWWRLYFAVCVFAWVVYLTVALLL